MMFWKKSSPNCCRFRFRFFPTSTRRKNGTCFCRSASSASAAQRRAWSSTSWRLGRNTVVSGMESWRFFTLENSQKTWYGTILPICMGNIFTYIFGRSVSVNEGTPLKTNMTLENPHVTCSIGNISCLHSRVDFPASHVGFQGVTLCTQRHGGGWFKWYFWISIGWFLGSKSPSCSRWRF